jgi:hypothetical protein
MHLHAELNQGEYHRSTKTEDEEHAQMRAFNYNCSQKGREE